MNTERPQTVMLENPAVPRLDATAAEYLPRHERQQYRLTTIGITVDKYGRAHDAKTGRFMKMGQLSAANVQALDAWQDYIVENAPTVGNAAVPALAQPEPGAEVIPRAEAVFAQPALTARERAKRTTRSLPSAARGLVGKGLKKVGERIDRSPRRMVYANVLAGLAVGAAVTGTVMRVYLGSRYGYAGAPEKPGGLFDLAAAHLGSTATHHHAAVVDVAGSANGSGKYQAVQEINTSSMNSSGKQEAVNEVRPAMNTRAKLETVSEVNPHLTAQEKQQLLNQLHPGVHHNVRHNPGTHVGFPRTEFVDPGSGYTYEFQDIAEHWGVQLSTSESVRAYNEFKTPTGVPLFLTDGSYMIQTGPFAGQWGIDHPGLERLNPHEVALFHHWLVVNGFLES